MAASSAGIASAPDPHARTDERSRCSAPASSNMRYIAGTPMKIDARRCSIASSTSVGRNFGMKYTGMPAHASPRIAANPMMCATGNDNTAPPRTIRLVGMLPAAATWPDERAMRELDTLGLAGGARRVEERGDVVGIRLVGGQQRVGAVDLRGGPQHERRRRVVDDVTNLVRSHLRVDRNRHARRRVTPPGTAAASRSRWGWR